MYDKNYYNDKKAKLEARLRAKKDDFINSVLFAVQEFSRGQMEIKQDYTDIMSMEKKSAEKDVSQEKKEKK